MYRASIPSEEVNLMPLEAFKGPISVIESPDQVERAVAVLTECSILGFDTETKPSFTRGEHHKVALLQLSTAKEAFLFRLDKIGLPDSLIPLLENPYKLKIGAAVTDDIRGLQKHNKFKAGGFVDLQMMMPHYGILDKALKKMAALVLGIQISKSQQTSNWEADPYTPEQILYAATDASVCRDIFIELMLNGIQIALPKQEKKEVDNYPDAAAAQPPKKKKRRFKRKKKNGAVSAPEESKPENDAKTDTAI